VKGATAGIISGKRNVQGSERIRATMDSMRTSGAAFVRRRSLRPSELLRRLRDPSPPIAGLLIDLCGVLYDESVWRLWLFKLVQHLGLHTTYTPFFRIWQRDYLDRVKRLELDYWEAFRLFLRSAGLTSGQTDEVEAAGHARYRQYESEILPLPGVVPVLSRLNELGVQLTLFSSAYFSSAEVGSRLKQLGLESYFQAALSVPELWRQYPDRPVFEVAMESTGLAPGRLAFIGRDTAMLAEAGAVGIRRIAVNYDDDAVADILIGNIDQLLEAVPWDAAPTPVG
jgi:FMN phosphatase YigB (HAD superfamily)